MIHSAITKEIDKQIMSVLHSCINSGNPPTAVQIFGSNIIDWVKLDGLANLNDIAEEETGIYYS